MESIFNRNGTLQSLSNSIGLPTMSNSGSKDLLSSILGAVGNALSGGGNEGSSLGQFMSSVASFLKFFV